MLLCILLIHHATTEAEVRNDSLIQTPACNRTRMKLITICNLHFYALLV